MSFSVKAAPYDWPHDGPVDPSTVALVIIDMQKDFCCDGGYMAFQGYDLSPTKAIIPQIHSLLTAFRGHKMQVYHTREGHRPDLSSLSSRELHRSRINSSDLGIGAFGPMGRILVRGEEGHDTINELYPIPGEPVIDKPGRSAFQHTDFGLLLAVKGITRLILCGVTTDVCVSSTMRDANDRGMDCLLIEDACVASREELHESTIKGIKEEGGIFGAVSTTEALLEAMRKRV